VRFALLSLALFAAVVTAAGCSDDNTGTTTSSSGSSAPANPTFEKNVMPIMIQSCALTSCHSSKEAPAGVNITADKAVTYAAFMKESTNFAGTKLVVPGDPDSSLLMRKMDGTQAELESCPGDCGKAMPPPEEDGEQLLSQKKRDTVRNWIKNGAKND